MSSFGSGAAWASFANDETVSLELLSALASWFVILQPKPVVPLAVDDPTDTYDEPTGTGQGLPRTSTAVVHGSMTTLGIGSHLSANHFVFRLKKKPQSHFDFISVGRHADNDVHVPDESLSRFHAFFRETKHGLVVVDARSQNGTFLKNARIATQGQGESLVAAGDAIRFGEVNGVVLDAKSLYALIRRQ